MYVCERMYVSMHACMHVCMHDLYDLYRLYDQKGKKNVNIYIYIRTHTLL